ncbi:hypothetical protein PF010_g11418 [Phytophthora fragariae]|uniref:DUF501 domain-containing protein n=1 Tax=Phytophthora fragariae TaxID=53985 RepID=A0A6G0NZP4_9STRA|nr:hypothetical protein PF010_g11418 [Phytophthora fragariae]KAE9229097.1 hypothetical protein PF004_g10869 [Phytophthora fragariae]
MTTEEEEHEVHEVHEGVPCEAPAADVAQVREELGYVPNNLVRVAAFVAGDGSGRTSRARESAEQRPATLLLYPLRSAEDAYKKKQRAKVEPFPTIYWLSSTELKARVSALEDQQLVLALQRRLDADDPAKQKMKQSHREYAEQRWLMMTPRDLELVKGRRWEFFLRDVGIAGIREYTNVKCLHTHYAHYLATGNNLVGEWVQELLDSAAATERTEVL